MNKDKKQKILKLLNDYINDIELNDIEIEVTGYKEYDIVFFKTNLNANKILKDIIKIMEA